MTLHQLRPVVGHADANAEFPDDPHPDFDDFDDFDDSTNRYGSADRQYRHAHRTISATILSTLSGIRLSTCQAFHCALFGLLEDVGDYDGLIATSGLLIAGRPDRLQAAAAWLAANPPPDRESLTATAPFDEPCRELDERIADIVERHSLDLAVAADSNPSLTMGCDDAVRAQVGDEVLDLIGDYQVDEIDRLTTLAIELLGRLPDPVRLRGDAVRLSLAGRPSSTASSGILEV